MYRIHFDFSKGCFVVQVLWLGLFWRTVKAAKPSLTDCLSSAYSPLLFESCEEARAHVANIGLSSLYNDKSTNTKPAFGSLFI